MPGVAYLSGSLAAHAPLQTTTMQAIPQTAQPNLLHTSTPTRLHTSTPPCIQTSTPSSSATRSGMRTSASSAMRCLGPRSQLSSRLRPSLGWVELNVSSFRVEAAQTLSVTFWHLQMQQDFCLAAICLFQCLCGCEEPRSASGILSTALEPAPLLPNDTLTNSATENASLTAAALEQTGAPAQLESVCEWWKGYANGIVCQWLS